MPPTEVRLTDRIKQNACRSERMGLNRQQACLLIDKEDTSAYLAGLSERCFQSRNVSDRSQICRHDDRVRPVASNGRAVQQLRAYRVLPLQQGA
jgi:hypothetical protein